MPNIEHLDQILLILIWCIILGLVLAGAAALADWLAGRINVPKPKARRNRK